MELRHLRYFVVVAEELNFRRAADRLCMEQPPLSRQIQQLEREIGVLLFHRIKRHIELTAAGQVFLEEARRTLTQAEKAIYAAQQTGRGQAGNLTVAFCFCIDKSSEAFVAFPEVAQTFRRQRPDIRLTLAETCSTVQAKALIEREIDVGFMQIPVTDNALVSHSLMQEPLVLALPEGHPLSVLPKIPLAALGAEKFLLFPEAAYPALYQEIMAACAKAGFQPHIVQEVASSQMAVRLVAAGMGIAFAGASLAGTQPGVIFRAIEDFPLTLQLWIAWRRDNVSAALTEFVDLTRKLF